MPTPFPGMDPYLEHPALWPGVHNRLVVAIADAITPVVAPRYYVAVEERAYRDEPGDLSFVGVPDASVVAAPGGGRTRPVAPGAEAAVAVLDVEVPLLDPAEVKSWFLGVHETTSRRLVTVLELLSPANKRPGRGRDAYDDKRQEILHSRTNLVEIDLLRDGPPMDVIGPPARGGYRILISRGDRRPRARLYWFGLRDPIPVVPLPLLPGDDEPPLDSNAALHALYDRARLDLQLDYTVPPEPPLPEPDAAWARERIALRG